MKRNRTARSSRLRATHSHALRARRFFRPLLEQFEDRRLLATVTVNTTSDVSDGTTTSITALLAAPGADGFISLREAIVAANNTANVDGPDLDSDPDSDVVNFNIPGTGVKTITPTSALPTITEAVVIDGYSQPSASANTLVVGSNAVLLIEVSGASAGGGNGFTLGGIGGSTIRGLSVNRFGSSGVVFLSSNNVVEGSYLGVDASGTIERSNSFAGVSVTSGTNNRIGGTTTQARNVLAGNGSFVGTGQIVVGRFGNPNPVGTVIRGNYIGVTPAGNAAVHPTANGNDVGIFVAKGDTTIIGGGDADDGLIDSVVLAGNVISGNSDGIHIDPSAGDSPRVNGITIQGNIIGLDATGTLEVGNFGDGIFAGTAINSNNMQIGGKQPGAGNTISANDVRGFIGGALNMDFEGNRVGTDVSGTLDFGNGIDGSAGQGNGGQGVHISLGGNEGPNFQIRVGGTTAEARNIISGNAAQGIWVTGVKSGSVMIQGNYIGTQADGQTPLPNLFSGIEMNRSVAVGGTDAGAGNVIAFNMGSGVFAPTSGNGPFVGMSVLGNSIYSNGPNPPQPFAPASLGIDLNNVGPSLNDAGDVDTNINNNGQNFPVITSATTTGGATTIVGTLNSVANATFRVELFASAVADPSGFGEGQTYLGFTTVTTDGSGNGSFSFSPAVAVPTGQFITSTATDAAGNTSEFSAIRVVPVPPLTLSINDVSSSEGNSGPTAFAFMVTLSGNPTSNVTVTVNTANGTTNPATTADSDFAAITNQVLTFVPSGPLTQTVTVNVTGDAKFERDETFFVNLSNPSGATTSDNQGLGTIQNDDVAPTLTVSTNNSVQEGDVAADNRQVQFTLSLSAISGVDVAGTVTTASGTASEGVDFVSADGIVISIPAGQTQTTIFVSVIEDTTFEDDEKFSLTATVNDGTTISNAAGTASAQGTILNDDAPPNQAPAITSNGGGDTASVDVPENATAVTTVTAADPDAGTTLTYSIVGGADMTKFSINTTSGELAFATAPDFEVPTDADANNSYLVIVQASDGSLTDSQTLTVAVTNANEPPVITSNGGGDTATILVPENATIVTTVTASDSDAGATLSYSIAGGADMGSFSINATSGVLAFITAPNFEAPTDADSNNTYLVIVQASDGSLTDTQTLTVTVTNVNEPPVITSNGGGATAGVSVPENTTAVTSVTANDPDVGTTIVYSISGGADAAQFAINPSSGGLTFVAAPDFEAPTDADANNSYVVILQASDGSLTDSQTLTVTVTNANESPVITSNGGGAVANISVVENTSTVTTVAATDPDAGTTVVFSLAGGADQPRFTINATTGALTFVSAPNFESPTDVGENNVYEVTVQASDGTLIDTQAISVTVTDVAEADYTISGRVYKDVTGNGMSADDTPWTLSSPVSLNLYRDVNGDGVYQASDTWLASTLTGSGGVYSIVAPAVGKYIIKEVVPNNFVRTFPVLSDYEAVNLTTSSSNGNDWYNAPKYDVGIVTNLSFIVDHGGVLTTVSDLRGNTHEGDRVTANFTVASDVQFTLVSYLAPGPTFNSSTASQQTVSSFATATFGPGPHSLTVEIPQSFYQIDFVVGSYINQLGPAGSNIFYSAQCRLISADNGGVNLPNEPAIDLALSTSVDNPAPLLGSKVVLTVKVSNAAGWSAAAGVRVKDSLPPGLTYVSSTATQGTYNFSSGEWNLVNPLNSGATATLTITATVATAGEKRNAAQVTVAGAPDIDSTPNNDPSPSTPHNEDDDDSVSISPQLWTKFFVVNDSSSGSTREKTFEYAPDGTGVENYQLNSGNTAPRGAATTAAGNKVWVVDANKKVYVYDASGNLLGSWSAGSLTSGATPEGIATNGTDIWIVDAKQDKVFKYTNAASRTSGSQNAASSFNLASGNACPKDLVTDGTSIWVVNDAGTDKVFKYNLAGTLLGSWTISTSGLNAPTGITLDPASPSNLWIVDSGTDRVYQYDTAVSRTSGSQGASTSFSLGSGNTNPQGIADPPVGGSPTSELAAVATGEIGPAPVLAGFHVLSGIGRKSTDITIQDEQERQTIALSNPLNPAALLSDDVREQAEAIVEGQRLSSTYDDALCDIADELESFLPRRAQRTRVIR